MSHSGVQKESRLVVGMETRMFGSEEEVKKEHLNLSPLSLVLRLNNLEHPDDTAPLLVPCTPPTYLPRHRNTVETIPFATLQSLARSTSASNRCNSLSISLSLSILFNRQPTRLATRTSRCPTFNETSESTNKTKCPYLCTLFLLEVEASAHDTNPLVRPIAP